MEDKKNQDPDAINTYPAITPISQTRNEMLRLSLHNQHLHLQLNQLQITYAELEMKYLRVQEAIRDMESLHRQEIKVLQQKLDLQRLLGKL